MQQQLTFQYWITGMTLCTAVQAASMHRCVQVTRHSTFITLALEMQLFCEFSFPLPCVHIPPLMWE